jgi:lipoyl(octanoyl) transferase
MIDTANSDPMSWRYFGLVEDSGQANMALDRSILEQLCAGTLTCPVIRFYLWGKPTISLGTNQTADEVVDIVAAARLGYDIVSRPTGGRALLHKGDICYAIAAHKDFHPHFHSLTSTYRAIGATIADMLQTLGVQLTDLPSEGTESRRSLNPCFAMLSPFEVTVAGKKICGSAQYRSGGFFLQHGSIRVRNVWGEDDLTSLWPSGYKLEGEKITCLDLELGRKTDFSEIEGGFLSAVKRNFSVQILRT